MEKFGGPELKVQVPLIAKSQILELVLERELDYPCVSGTDYLSEIACRQVIDRVTEVDLVERVEELCPELYLAIAFTDGEILHQPEVRA
jgi:hypothetical protein